MSKRSSSVKKAPPSDRRQSTVSLDAGALFEMLESHFEAEGAAWFWQVYDKALKGALVELGQEARNFNELLENVDAYSGVAIATRKAGFILGFSACRQLMLGELDLEALKAGEQ